MVKRKLKTPLVYFGGKTQLAPYVLEQIPPHKKFVDVFGGGAAILLAKKPSEYDVYNDVGFVYTFFKVLRNHPDELYNALRLTPWSRKEFEESLNWRSEDDEVEKARKWFVQTQQGFTHEENCTSWLINKGASSAKAFANRIELIPAVAEHFHKYVHLENRSFEELIPLYDHSNVCFYCDPPYIAEARSGSGGYENEMSYEDHELLLDMLNEIEGQAVVSNYPSPLYNERLMDWRLVKVTRPSAIHNSKSKNVGDRYECIWIKELHHGLWSGWGISEEKEVSKNVSAIQSEAFVQGDLFPGCE